MTGPEMLVLTEFDCNSIRKCLLNIVFVIDPYKDHNNIYISKLYTRRGQTAACGPHEARQRLFAAHVVKL
jgi:hypothetical protein